MLYKGAQQLSYEGTYLNAPRIFKNTYEERVFEKMVSSFTVLEGIFEPNLRIDFFSKIFERDFYNKIEGDFNFFFVRDFFYKIYPTHL